MWKPALEQGGAAVQEEVTLQHLGNNVARCGEGARVAVISQVRRARGTHDQ
jgi:hypothetical protein